jgi:osmotically inducible protein OsmC
MFHVAIFMAPTLEQIASGLNRPHAAIAGRACLCRPAPFLLPGGRVSSPGFAELWAAETNKGNAMPISTANAEWKGSLREGRGQIRLQSKAFEGEFTFASRFETGQLTNPEELIAGAHAGCFSMQLSGLLTAAGTPPTSIATTAKVEIKAGAGGANITSIVLDTVGVVPGIDAAKFKETAEKAKEICPVSKALKAVGNITLNATLK